MLVAIVHSRNDKHHQAANTNILRIHLKKVSYIFYFSYFITVEKRLLNFPEREHFSVYENQTTSSHKQEEDDLKKIIHDNVKPLKPAKTI